jgi:hypothetical protein
MFEEFNFRNDQIKINLELLKRIERIERLFRIIPGDRESFSMGDPLPLLQDLGAVMD